MSEFEKKSMEYKMDDVPYWWDLKKAWDKAVAEYVKFELSLRDLMFIELMTFYGRRIGELSMLRVDAIDFENKIIKFPVEKVKGGTPTLSLPIFPIVEEHLKRYVGKRRIEGGDLMFDMKIRQMRNIIYSHTWRNLYDKSYEAKDGKVLKDKYGDPVRKTLRPHAFRHALAQYMLTVLKDSRFVSRFFGHRSLKTIDVYARYEVDDLGMALQDLGKYDMKKVAKDNAERVREDLKSEKLFF